MIRVAAFFKLLRFAPRLIGLICAIALCAGAGTTSNSAFPTITASGQPIASVFDGLVPSQQLRDAFVLKTRPLGSPTLPNLSKPNIGQILGIGPVANSCPGPGICANPGTTGVFGEHCQDAFGCSVDVHNQGPGQANQGVMELYQCDQCCVDWYPCPISTGGGGGSSDCDPSTDLQCLGSPIIIDTTGHGFILTSSQNGVHFDIRATGKPVQIAWTAAGSGNAFLALDRNGNGTIDSGAELFGNYTTQPQSANPNGFLALAEFDKPENGGNGDGMIDARDAVFSRLLLWIDENHDGVSQPNELHSLPSLGVTSISLTYHISWRTDQFGNVFRDRAKVNPNTRTAAPNVGPEAYDVFFTEVP